MIQKVYKLLIGAYGPQGWWPLHGKHSGTPPKTEDEQFEIALGAILTQNTSWKNVEKALKNFKIISKEHINQLSDNQLKEIIRPAGYYNQKTRKIREFLKLKTINRESLLNTWGIGPETADSILLYSYNQPFFVIDNYTKRIFSRLNLKFTDYNDLQQIFHKEIKPEIYKEYHALIVEHCKQHCLTKPKCDSCPLLKICNYSH